MNNYIYSRFDHAAGTYSPPFIAANDDVACRTYLYLFGFPQKLDFKFYSFHRLGIFNNETGAFERNNVVELTPFLSEFIEHLQNKAVSPSDADVPPEEE